MEKDGVTSPVFVHPQTESDVSEWQAINYLRERLFCDICGKNVGHGRRKDDLVICVENVAHATCVNVLGGSNSRPPTGVVHIVLDLERLFVVMLRMRHQVDRTCMGSAELKMFDLTRARISPYLLGLKYSGKLVSLVSMNGGGL